ncbi:CHASE2 domain-containing protein [Roseateles cellulosilyticus]|uniref:CHASE2 domain-containing protein n=1 Tax=Pelomonas cellulosilytica TaxID=2906762 RepID=A0ABS8XTX2_9BURK|nr:CHASE2 domain-containing protein [Pelomonas sp. P8]MCE4554281.1 CHASE2 domain-containing protein [Pelomonas sp. P8]
MKMRRKKQGVPGNADRNQAAQTPLTTPSATTPPSSASTAQRATPQAHVGRRPTHKPWSAELRHLMLGIVITVAMISLKVAFEHTPWGEAAEQYTYRLLSRVLPEYRRGGTDVVLIDISRIRGGESLEDGKLRPTSRVELQDILTTLAQMRPYSIGVDIDFSPTIDGWVDDSDPEFFKYCLKLKQATPIALGVFRSLREPRAAWLGLPEFASLAGGMWLPPTGLERTPAWTQAPGVADKLPSLGAKLASAHGEEPLSQEDEQGLRRRFRERVVLTQMNKKQLLVGEVLTNHSLVGQLKEAPIRITKAKDLLAHRERIVGRIVIVGDLRPTSGYDSFDIPTEPSGSPGMVVHASNAYTLAAEPVWEFSHTARFGIDLTLSAALIGAAIWLKRSRSSWSTGNATRSQFRALFWLIAVTIAACALAVYSLRVFWLDFFLVAASLLLHPSLEKMLHRRTHNLMSRTHTTAAHSAS